MSLPKCTNCQGRGCSKCEGTGRRAETRGTKKGSFAFGTYGGWLATAKAGAVWWSERDSRSLAGDAIKAQRRVKTTVYYAVTSTGKRPTDVHAIKVTRVEMFARIDGTKEP